jgi:hypothetical protein
LNPILDDLLALRDAGSDGLGLAAFKSIRQRLAIQAD